MTIANAKANANRRSTPALRLIVVIAAGVLLRKCPGPIPHEVRKIGGDILWGTMFYLLNRLLFRQASRGQIAVTAFAIASATEFLKLVHSPGIDALRATPLGGFLLGRVFLPTNFLFYALGVALGALAEPRSRNAANIGG